MFLSKKYFVVVFFKSYTCNIIISFLQRIWQFELISETSPKVMEDPMVNHFPPISLTVQISQLYRHISYLHISPGTVSDYP